MVYAALMLAGVVGGFLAGLLGIGGGFVVVPVLLLLLPALGVEPGIVPNVAVATSLAAMVPTALSATIAHWRRGALDRAWLARLAPATAVGAALGSQVASRLSGGWVALVFAVYCGYFALKMLRDPPLRSDHGGRVARYIAAVPVPVVALLIGGFSAIAGVGGASLTVPFLLFQRVDMKRAVAVSSAVGLTIAMAGSAGFAGPAQLHAPAASSPGLVGLVSWPAALLLAASAMLMAPRGVAAAHALPVRHLKRAFGGVLVMACAATLLKFSANAHLLQHAGRVLAGTA